MDFEDNPRQHVTLLQRQHSTREILRSAARLLRFRVAAASPSACAGRIRSRNNNRSPIHQTDSPARLVPVLGVPS